MDPDRIKHPSCRALVNELKRQGWQPVKRSKPLCMVHPTHPRLAAIVQRLTGARGQVDFKPNW